MRKTLWRPKLAKVETGLVASVCSMKFGTTMNACSVKAMPSQRSVYAP